MYICFAVSEEVSNKSSPVNKRHTLVFRTFKKLNHTVIVPVNGSVPKKGTLENVDLLAIEITSAKGNLGQWVAKAVEMGVPVLALYDVDVSQYKPLLISAEDSKIATCGYRTKSIKSDLSRALADIGLSTEEKFSLTLSPRLSAYLKWSSDAKKLSKSSYLRDLLEEKMRKDNKYKKVV
jgi:hypothetical protein